MRAAVVRRGHSAKVMADEDDFAKGALLQLGHRRIDLIAQRRR